MRISDWSADVCSSDLASGTSTRLAVAGMDLPYSVPNWAVDHFPADVGLPLGFARGNANLHGAFFTESFMDELAHQAQMEAMSFRIQMLGGDRKSTRLNSSH